MTEVSLQFMVAATEAAWRPLLTEVDPNLRLDLAVTPERRNDHGDLIQQYGLHGTMQTRLYAAFNVPAESALLAEDAQGLMDHYMKRTFSDFRDYVRDLSARLDEVKL